MPRGLLRWWRTRTRPFVDLLAIMPIEKFEILTFRWNANHASKRASTWRVAVKIQSFNTDSTWLLYRKWFDAGIKERITSNSWAVLPNLKNKTASSNLSIAFDEKIGASRAPSKWILSLLISQLNSRRSTLNSTTLEPESTCLYSRNDQGLGNPPKKPKISKSHK